MKADERVEAEFWLETGDGVFSIIDSFEYAEFGFHGLIPVALKALSIIFGENPGKCTVQ